jgi:hypothetical protein
LLYLVNRSHSLYEKQTHVDNHEGETMKDQARTADTRNMDADTNVLAQIVEAMLAVQSDLEDASVEEWTRTLVASCRKQKRQAGNCRMPMASTC